MSRAFVKETDETFDELPDRPVSPNPNIAILGFPQSVGPSSCYATQPYEGSVRLHGDHPAG
jgi:hypothetical protein